MIIKLYDKESDKTTIMYNPIVATYDYGIKGGKFSHLSVIVVTAENTYDEIYLIRDKIDKESGRPYIHTYGVIADDKENIIDFNNILATRNYIEQEINIEANHDYHEERIIVEKYNCKLVAIESGIKRKVIIPGK